MSSGVEYVVAAYGVMAFALLVYLVVAAMKRARLSREAELLARLEAAREDDRTAGGGQAPDRDLESVDS
jgi:hypothetical protein